MSINEVIVKFKGRALFKQYIPKKRKRFGIKMFKLCDSTGYTYDLNVYLGKDRQRAEQHLTATHATVTNLTRGVEGFGHKLYSLWTTFFPPLTSMTTWPRKKFYVVGQLGHIERTCPRTSDPRH